MPTRTSPDPRQVANTVNRAHGRPITLTEATNATPAPADGSGSLLVQLISPGWGSSGYYSADVLAAAAEAKVWPTGTHLYLDHPTVTEDAERPERSVRDLAGVLTEDARVAEDGALVATARVYSPYRAVLGEAAEDIGMSIRATAEVHDGDADGRTGLIIDRLVEGLSVDFVTRAGRGGRILAVLESARPTAPAREAHGMTANDLRDALRSACTAAFGGEDIWTWVRDYTDDWVVVDVESPDSDVLYQQTYTVADDGSVTLTGDPVEVTAHTSYVAAGTVPRTDIAPAQPTESHPVTAHLSNGPAAGDYTTAARSMKTSTTGDGKPPTATNESERSPEMGDKNEGGGTATESATRTIGEADRLATLLAENRTALAEATKRAETAEAERDTATARALLAEAKLAASDTVRAKLAASPLKEASWPAVTAAVLDSLTVDESGKVDQAKLTEAIDAEIEAERARVAALLEAHGVGVPRDLGGATKSTDVPDVDLAAEFAEFGLSESAAKLAAEGKVR